jgi:hypothetical protein
MNKVEILEKMGKLPPNDLGLSQGKSYCPFCGVELTHNEFHQCVSHTKSPFRNDEK